MALTISWDSKPILQCSNCVFERLYIEIVDAIEKNNIHLIFHLRELINNMDRCGYGIGLDLYKFIYSKEDLKIFIQILKEAMNKLLDYPYKHFYENFYRELLIAYESFEPDPSLLKSVQEFNFYFENEEEWSGVITYDKKYLLACPIPIFQLIFNELSETIKGDAILLSENLKELIHDLQDISFGLHGYSVDLSYYSNSKEEIAFFSGLIKKTINTIYQQYPEHSKDYAQYYERFYNNLCETIEHFPHFTTEESKFTPSEISSYKSKKKMDEYYLKNNITK